MSVPFRSRIRVLRGFRPDQPRLNSPFSDSILDGLNVLAKGGGQIRTFRQIGGIGGSGANVLMLVGSTVGGAGSGSVILGPGGGLWGIGSGTGFGAGQSFSLSSILQFLRSGVLYQAGLNPPNPPSIRSPLALDTDAIKMFGVFSARLTKKRNTTGHESNISKVSNVVFNRASDGKYKNLIIDIGANDEQFDYYGLYLSRARQGNTGPHYWYDDYLKATTTIVLDINDANLSDLLGPTDHFPPPTGTHVIQLGGVVDVLGCYGGNGSCPTIPGMFESFPPLFTTFFPEGIVGVKGRATDGWIYVLCLNSLNAALLTGSTSTPIIPRTIWPELGFQGPHQATLVGAQLYAAVPKPVRTLGDAVEPDSTFADPIIEWMRRNGFTNPVVGYDPDEQLVIYSQGSLATAYDLTTGEWSTGISLGASPNAAVTANQKLVYSVGGSSLFTFDTGATQAWYLYTTWEDGGYPKIYKIITDVFGSGDNGVQVALLINLSATPQQIKSGVSALGLTGHPNDHLESYIVGVENFAAKISGSSGQSIGFDEFIIEGLAFPKMKISV
jgi:hypothetical protein